MDYTISKPDLDRDRAAVLDLWMRNLPDACADRYQWLYRTETATAWVLRDKEGSLVGATGLMERAMRVLGDSVRAGQAIDLNVDKEHRTIGPALGLQRAVTANVKSREYGLIYAMPNAQSELVLRRAGYKVLGDVGRWGKPLCCQEILSRWLRSKLLRKTAALLIDPLLRLVSPETYYRRPAGLHVEVADQFDRRFDALWEAAAQQFRIIGERTSAYLNWRFCRCPEVRHRVLCLCGADGELLAYLVYYRHAGTVYIGDFLFADPQTLDLLLAEFLRRMRREKAQAVIAVYLGPDLVCQKLRRFGFWQRPSPWKALVCVDRQRFGSELDHVLDTENWYLTRADVDTDS